MSGGRQLGIVAAALAAAAAAFVIVRPGDGAGPSGAETRRTSPAPAATGKEPAEGPAARPQEPVTVRVRRGKPVGGVARVEVDKGDRVRVEVMSDAPHVVHLHGYDLFEDVRPGRAARFIFVADLEGIFELELEGVHEQIAELRVNP
ncbi:MAG TPA: hypothetical protein VNT32_15430 [Thermoleophilaceae bacterium]|nr:hypothetical protein [Thermoleophilaceae bacterium]